MGILTFDFVNEIITVPSAYTEISMQTLIDEIRDEEEELSPAMAYYKIADASGKDSLGGGIYTAITVRLMPNWQLKFEDRPGPATVQVYVKDGNLVGGDTVNGPIAVSSYVQVVIQTAQSGTISVPSDDVSQHLKYLIGSLFESHTLVGNFIYWDPYSGDDASDGSSPTNAVATFDAAHTIAIDNHNDIIIAIPSDPSGVTTYSDDVRITKKNLRVRGPGYNFRIVPTDQLLQSVDIDANNVEVSGFYITTPQASSMNGVRIRGDNNLLKNCWIDSPSGSGIFITSADRNRVSNCVIESAGTIGSGAGINFFGTSSYNLVEKCIVSETIDGVKLAGTSLVNNVFENNLVFGNSNYGFNIDSSSNNTTIRSGHTLANNTAGDYNDNGVNTTIESSIGGASPADIADSVWDEVISDRTTTGTAGKTLRDAKTKATLASLK